MKKIYFLLFTVLFAANAIKAQITITVTGNTNTTPALAASYPSLAAAITDLNTVTAMTGPVVFDMAAGTTESVATQLSITTAGSAANSITFQKSGAGANPKLTRTDAGTNTTSTVGGLGDGIIKLEGTDNIIFDGLDLQANDQGIEYGYYTNKTATDACQGFTIKNCAITMTKGTSAYVFGIYISNGTVSTSSATGVTVSANSGRTENVTITGNTISNVHGGIYCRGNSTAAFYDQNFVIGQSGAGNTIQNYGGGSATTTYGVYFIYTNNPTVGYNTFNNAGGGGTPHGSTFYGIFYSTVTGDVVGNNNNFTINTSGTSAVQVIYNANAVTSNTFNNNSFSGTIAATSTSYLIYASSATPLVTITGNQVSGTFTKTGTSGTLYCYYNLGSPSSGTETITNNNFSNISTTGTSSTNGIYSNTAVGQTRICSNNTINNWTIGSGSSYGIYNLSGTDNQINGNIVSNITGTTNTTFVGLYFTGTNPSVYNNTIFGLSSAGTQVHGIQCAGTGTVNLYNNKVYGLSTTSTGTTAGMVSGFNVSTIGTSTNIYNNLVGGLAAAAATGGEVVRGISITGTTASSTINLSFNTIYLTGAGGTNFGSTGLHHTYSATITSANLVMKNNIIVNATTPNGSGIAVAFRRSAATSLANYNTSSNNNLFYAGTPGASNLLFYDGTNAEQLLSGLKIRLTPGESASISENPNFVSTTGSSPNYLHINTGIGTQIESGGMPVAGITMDFDGDTRNITTPDIGADEFNGIALDLTPPATSYSTLSNTLCLTDRTLTATITDASGVNTAPGTRPRLYFKKSGNADTYVDNTNATNGWKYVEATGAGGSPFSFTTNYSLLFGGVPVAIDNIQYFVVAQDVAGTPNVGINSGAFAATPTSVALTPAAFPIGGTVNNYTINGGGLSGTVTIGAAGTYPSLTGAGGLFAALNTGGLTGNLTADIIDATVAEDGSNALNQLSYGCAPFYTLLIKPGTGVNAALTGSSSTALIKLNGADYVTIDGSNNGSSSQNLTIENTATTTNTAAIWVASLGTGAGATNNTIKNTTVRAGSNTVTSTFGIFVGGASISTSGTGNDNDDLTIQNNGISKAYYGIYAAASAAARNDNMVISQNSIGSTLPAEYISFRGMLISQADNASISQNTVFNIVTATTNLRAMEFGAGFINAVVNRNLIYNISNGTTTFSGAKGMSFAPGAGLGTISIRNNVIYGLNGNGSNTITNNSWGIMLESGTAYSIYYNSVNQSDNRFTTSSTANDGCMYVASAVTAIDLRNNVFSATAIAGNAGGKCYGIYSAAANTAYTNINYNDFYAPGTSNRFAGFIGSDRITIADIQTGFGQNANSIVADPLFNSAVFLVPQTGSPLVAAATPIAGVTTDILGVTRNAVTPTIGAYETAGDFAPPVISYTPIPGTLCLADQSLSATITDASGVNVAPGTKPRLYFKKSADANTYVGNTSGDNGWKYVEASNAASPFSFTTNFALLQAPVTGGDIIQYFVVAQDLASPAVVGINSGVFNATPASVNLAAGNFPITGTINSYNIGAGGISGTVTIGAAGTYTTLTGAGGLFAALNAGGLTGNVTANILDALVTEPGTNALNQMAYSCGGPFTLTIKPNTGVTASLSNAFSGYLIRILSSNVIIDGSNNGSTSRDLTIENTTTTSPSVLLIGSTGVVPITNVTVKNSILINGANTNSAVVVSDGVAPATAGYFNNITIQNNSIQKAYIANYNIAVVAPGNGSGLLITGNDINTAGANSVRLVPIYVQGIDGATISNNNLGNIANTLDASNVTAIWLATGTVNTTISGNNISSISTTSGAPRGIAVSSGATVTNVVVTGNTINGLTTSSTGTTTGIYLFSTTGNVEISKNKISDIKNTNGTGFGSNGIQLATTLTGANIDVNNNFVWDITGNGFNGAAIGDNGYGIIVTAGGGYNIDYNTIHLNTEQVSATGRPMAINITSGVTAAGAINLRNNILATSQLVGTNRYAIYSAAASAVFGTIDYNDYSSAGPNLGFIGVDRTTLADIQTGFGGNLNSKNALPVFVGANDLHLSTAAGANWCLNGTATPLVGITTDIDGDTRNVTTPDMGADEFAAVGSGDIATPASQTVCTGVPITTIVLSGGAASYNWTRDNTVSVTGIGTNGSGNISGTLNNATASPVTVTFTITPVDAGGCFGPSILATVVVNPINAVTLTSAAGTDAQTVCINTPITNITYATTGATGATVTGLPAGVIGSWAANVVTISGTPTTTVGSPFSYTVTLTGGCGSVTANGTITVTPDNTITLSSAPGTDAQTVCINTPIINITYTTTGATGATFSGLPAGVTGSWAANVVTISGSPNTTVGSPFSYTVTLTGGCGTVTATGSITVTPNNTITLTSVAGTDAQSVCLNSPITNITYSTTGATGATFSGLPAGVTGNWAANVVTISGTPTTTVGSPFSYTVTLTGGCGNITANGTITVNPLPVISSTQVEPTTCASADGSITLTLSGAPGPYTFAWTGSGVNPTSQNQTGLTVGNYGVTVTAANGCSATASFALAGPGGCSICPTIPTFVTTPTGAACFGNNVTFTASGLTDMGGTYGIIFKYSVAPLANPYAGGTVIATVANGALTSGGTVATANSASIPVGTYNVYAILTPTPVDPACRPAALVNLTIGAVPDVNQPANQVVCNNFPTAAVNFTGTLPGTVFNWTNSDPSIGLAASGTGDIPSFTATNAGTAPVVATVTVTPQISSGGGGIVTNALATIVLNSAIAGGPAMDVAYNPVQNLYYAVTGNSPSVPIQTFSAAGTLLLDQTNSGHDWRGIWWNPNGNTLEGNSCSACGTPGIRIQNLNGSGYAINTGTTVLGPNQPVFQSQGDLDYVNNEIIYYNSGVIHRVDRATNANLPNINITGLPVGIGNLNTYLVGYSGITGYEYMVYDYVLKRVYFINRATGAYSGTSQLPAAAPGTGSNWNVGFANGQIFVYNGSGWNAYQIYSAGGGGITCTGTPRTFTITVNPTPNAVATPGAQTICSGATITTIALTSAVSGTTYNWTRDNTGAVTGIAASGSGNISGALTNTTNAPVTVTFTITPTANGCAGAPITATVLVNPTPNAVATPASQTICSAATITTIVLSGNVSGTVYNWTRDNTVTVTGIAASGAGNIAGALTNTTNAPITVTFTITPTANGCAGAPITATVLVNPTPNAVATPASQAVCSAFPITTILMTGNVIGTTYNWTRDNTVTVTGMAASGSGNISGSLINVTAAPITVTFTITPTANGCPGAPITATITVTPQPAATISYAGSPYCSTDLTAPVTRTGTAGGTYSAAPAGLTINPVTGTVTPNTSTPGTYTVTYTVAPAGGCLQFVTTTTITITAAPNMIIFYAGNPYCSSAGTATVTRFGTPGGTYSSTLGLVINPTTGAVTLGTSTPGTYTVTYTVPASGGCGITQTTTSITIIPAPTATISYAGSPYCSNGGTATVTQTGTAGGTYSSTPGLTLNATTGAVTLGTSTPGTYTVTYTVVTAGGACPDFVTTTTITITQLPAATITYAGNPYCQNAGTANVTRTGTAGGVYSAAPAGLSINTATGAVTLGTSTAGTYTVTYTLAAGGGCPQVTATTSITITALPTATIVYTGTPFCQNAVPNTVNVTRTGTAGGTYSAAPAGLSINAATGTVTLATSTPGTYTVTYTIAAAGGCPAVTATTTITVQSLSTAATAANASATTLCGPGTVTLSVTGGALGTGATWRWYSGSCGGTAVGTGATLTGVTVNSTTTFYVRAEGTCNTTTCASVTVTVNTLPTITLATSAATLKPFQTATITATVTPGAGTTVIWYRNGVVVPGASGTSLVVDFDKLGTYTARATTTAGCTALSAAVTIAADPSNQLFITPNPNNGQFKVRFYTSANSLGFNRRIVMYNEAGQRVLDQSYPITAPYSSMDVDARRLPKGFYRLVLMDAFGNEVLGNGSVIIQ